MALTLSGSERIPSGVIRWSIKSTHDAPNMHLSGRMTSPVAHNKDNTD